MWLGAAVESSRMSVQNVIAFLSLIVAAVGLRYLIIYVKATKTIAAQSVEQPKAALRPTAATRFGSALECEETMEVLAREPASRSLSRSCTALVSPSRSRQYRGREALWPAQRIDPLVKWTRNRRSCTVLR